MHLFDLARIGRDLPVASAHDELLAAAATGAMVVTAPPGTGKTTFVPPLVANAVRDRGSVLLTQPRRVAVRAAAHRISQLDGSALGGPVGFTVRGERKVSPSTGLEVLTPGVLLRRLIADPELTGVAAVVLDEVHERSVDGDLLLGMLAEVRQLRDDLLVVAMSATLDAGRIADLLGDAAPAPVVDVPSPLFPLSIAYEPFAGPRLDERGITRGYLGHLARVAVDAQQRARSDALVFVPSARDVDEVAQLITQLVPASGQSAVEVLRLHGRLSSREQDRAVSGRSVTEPPRIVVSTSLAESSLTVPGVRLVIDAGLSREVRRDQGRDMSGLITLSASRASVDQRAGRAARQGPGTAIRVYSETDFAHMPRASAPEMASADLTDAALLLAAWGTPGGTGLSLPTPPPAAAMAQATRVLSTLDLTDTAGAITRLGRVVAGLPVGVREARALLAGAAIFTEIEKVAEIVAALAGDLREPGADLSQLLRQLRTGSTPGSNRWRKETQRLARIARDHAQVTSDDSQLTPGAIVALARPEWVAKRVSADAHGRSYLLATGTRAALPEGSGLIGSEWIAVREVQRATGHAADGTGAVIRLAAAIDEDEAVRFSAALLQRERIATITDGRVRVREERGLGAIVLTSAPVTATPEDTGPAFAEHLRAAGLDALDWSDAAQSLRGRLALLHRELGSPWPAVDDNALLGSIEDWLGPDLDRLRPSASLRSIDITSALRRLLPWPDAVHLDELAPERLTVPSGSSVRLDYPPAHEPLDPAVQPIAAVKLQEVFGLAETPRLIEGRVPVLFHLLSPARKPLAVTQDLSSFWNGPYQDVRKEMRGRYPRHPWPEDPWTAQATARTNRAIANRGA